MTGDTWRPMAEPTLTWKQYEMGRSALIDLLLTSTESIYTTAGTDGDTQCVLQQSTVDQADMPVYDGS